MAKKRTGESLKDLFKKEVRPREAKRQRTKVLKRQDAKALKSKRKHTIYLSPDQSRKLRLYAAENDLQISEVIEQLIAKNL